MKLEEEKGGEGKGRKEKGGGGGGGGRETCVGDGRTDEMVPEGRTGGRDENVKF